MSRQRDEEKDKDNDSRAKEGIMMSSGRAQDEEDGEALGMATARVRFVLGLASEESRRVRSAASRHDSSGGAFQPAVSASYSPAKSPPWLQL